MAFGGENAESYYDEGVTAFMRGDIDTALLEIEKAKAVAPNDPEPIRLFDAKDRIAAMKRSWKQTEAYAAGRISTAKFLEDEGSDHASDIIESMWGQLAKPFYINTTNGGAVVNLPHDAFLELRCDVDMRGPRPQPFGTFTPGLAALQHQVLDTPTSSFAVLLKEIILPSGLEVPKYTVFQSISTTGGVVSAGGV